MSKEPLKSIANRVTRSDKYGCSPVRRCTNRPRSNARHFRPRAGKHEMIGPLTHAYFEYGLACELIESSNTGDFGIQTIAMFKRNLVVSTRSQFELTAYITLGQLGIRGGLAVNDPAGFGCWGLHCDPVLL
jgi:hypothetical protein